VNQRTTVGGSSQGGNSSTFSLESSFPGANRGLGLEMCKQLSEGGLYTSIYALCRKSNEDLATLASSASGKIKIVENINVMSDDIETVARLAFKTSEASSSLIPIHLLVHNAGAYGPPGAADEATDYGSQSLSRIDARSMRYAFDLNTLAPLMLTKALLPNLEAAAMSAENPAKVIIISSSMGSIEENGSGGSYAYRTAKAGVNMVGKTLSMDLKDKNIAVGMSKCARVVIRMERLQVAMTLN
jgi:NAD(P)-dependent dehydrogenase (short-subunit alcohol dehydrogenase family)